jgi:hypothetical protein
MSKAKRRTREGRVETLLPAGIARLGRAVVFAQIETEASGSLQLGPVVACFAS